MTTPVMTIHTKAPETAQFVRIIGSFNMSDQSKVQVGKVGKVASLADVAEDQNQLVFVEINGDRLRVFQLKDLDYITEKEYFIGCLGG